MRGGDRKIWNTNTPKGRTIKGGGSMPSPEPEVDPFDGPGDRGLDYISGVTVKNIAEMPFPRMLELLSPHLLERVPEGIMGDKDALNLVDQQIGRFANLYAYLSVLFGFVGSEARRWKASDRPRYESLMAKKDALYRFLQAVELKWRSCSRQVTIETESEVDFERPNYGARQDKAAGRRVSGWDAVSR